MLTAQQKVAAITILDDEIPAVQVTVNSKYVQVPPYVVGMHTVAMDEYVGPLGVGYIRRVSRPDPDDAAITHIYETHSGPEDRLTGWSEYNASGP